MGSRLSTRKRLLRLRLWRLVQRYANALHLHPTNSQRRTLKLTDSLLLLSLSSSGCRRSQPLRHDLGDQALGSQVGYVPSDSVAVLEEPVPNRWK